MTATRAAGEAASRGIPASRRISIVRNAITFVRTPTKWSLIGDSTTKQIIFDFRASGKWPARSHVILRGTEKEDRLRRTVTAAPPRQHHHPQQRKAWAYKSVTTAENKPIITALSATASSWIDPSWRSTDTRVNKNKSQIFKFIVALIYVSQSLLQISP